MKQNQQLFDKCGGYRKLHSFTYATLIHLGTIKFCKRFVPWQEDPLGKTSGQMIGAARSGRQNIIEASERSATSKETELKLTDVARGSLAELLGDYEIYLADKGVIPWSRRNPEREKIGNIWLADFPFSDDSLHDYWKYFHEIKPSFDPWLESKNSVIAGNCLLVLIVKTMAMLDAQIKTLGNAFIANGGFKERMFQARTAERNNLDLNSPNCPICGKTMRQRIPKSGKTPGVAFWGCSAFPSCKGTREIKAYMKAFKGN